MKITNCKLRKSTQKKLLEYFILEMTARSAADLLSIQPNTAALFYRKIREVIFYNLEKDTQLMFNGIIHIDNNEYLNKCIKEENNFSNKEVIFYIIKHEKKVYTKMNLPHNHSPFITNKIIKINPDSMITTESLHHRKFIDISKLHQERNDSTNKTKEFKKNHFNGIENFWTHTKRILNKYNGIDRNSFQFYLKECEFRFNYGTYKQQLKTLTYWTGI